MAKIMATLKSGYSCGKALLAIGANEIDIALASRHAQTSNSYPSQTVNKLRNTTKSNSRSYVFEASIIVFV